ncbi:GHMP family kinase ATP-binding protein [Caproicibacter fermentans]|uniref:GHMP family kinase ATP-binding protein n=1 Tax=Caproicibacter fermentans TaxID=2576756 RepID=UPI0038B4027B
MSLFFREHGGSVISTTFDKFCYVTVRHQPQFFDYQNSVIYSRIENTREVGEIEHPLVRNAMQFLDMHELHIAYDADLPARSGLGSSSAFAVGLLNGFYALKGKYKSKRKLAKDAIYVERTLCKEDGGWQDQIAASFGGFNRINFRDDTFEVRPVIMSLERKNLLNAHLMLFFTGFSRFSGEIAVTQKKAIKDKERELLEMLSLVDESENILASKCDILDFGRLLDHTWRLKRGLTNKISTESIDDIYQKTLDAGAVGGKLLGAGGGGFLLLFVEPCRQQAVREALENFMYVPFRFEENGTQILYYAPEQWECTNEEEPQLLLQPSIEQKTYSA